MNEYPEIRHTRVKAGVALLGVGSLAMASFVAPQIIEHQKAAHTTHLESLEGSQSAANLALAHCVETPGMLLNGNLCAPVSITFPSPIVIEQTPSTSEVSPITQAPVIVKTAGLTPQVQEAPVTSESPAPSAPTSHQAEMAAAGIAASDFNYVEAIMEPESNWCATRWQGYFGPCPSTFQPVYSTDSDQEGYGIGQATPASKMAPFGADWRTNIITQLRWAQSYAKSKYGSWWNASQYRKTHGNW